LKLTLLERPTPITARDFKVRLEKELENIKGELTASLALDDFSPSGWARISVHGEDSEIVTELISNRFGLANTDPREIQVPGVYKAEIIGSNAKGLQCDFGLDIQDVSCTIPTPNLNAQLADGKNIRPRELIECYSLYPGVRITTRVTEKKGNEMEAWLSDEQMEHIRGWISIGLDRIQTFDCFREEAESAVVKTHLSRDVIAVESMTLTMQSIVCKLGTDAIGLIPKLGHILRRQKLTPFRPKKITARCRPW